MATTTSVIILKNLRGKYLKDTSEFDKYRTSQTVERENKKCCIKEWFFI